MTKEWHMLCFLPRAYRRGSSPHSRMWARGPKRDQQGRASVASFHSDHEKLSGEGVPSLQDMESGKLVGAVLPMSEQAQVQMRNSIEVIDYLLNQERVVWS
jgi:hypothetical protein